MEIETIKTVSIISYMTALGFTCSKVRGNKYWYMSPLHEETTPSFKVNAELNLWYDFALGRGGNIITLAKEMHPALTMHQVLVVLEEQIRRFGLLYENRLTCHVNDFIQNPSRTIQENNNTLVTQIVALIHPNLLYYLRQRRIDVEIAQHYCKEVHYTLINSDKHYYGIAFLNIELGMEVRNKFCKRCIGKKSYTYIVSASGHIADSCCIFEGFFDFLTYMTYKKWKHIGLCLDKECDYIVLNSVSSIKKAFEEMATYKHIHCYLDNDDAGHEGTESIKKQFPDKVIDESSRYSGFKDLNDVIIGQPIQAK